MAVALASLGHASTLLTDDFTVGISDIVMPGSVDYEAKTVDLGQDLLGYRSLSAANFHGSSGQTFTVSCGSGSLSATGTGDAFGLMELSYHQRPSGDSDLSNASSVTFDVAANTASTTVALGIYSGGYTHLSGKQITLDPGTTGRQTIRFADVLGDPLIANHVDSLFLDFNTSSGGRINLSRLTVEAVPEPASLLVLSLGVVPLLRRRAKRV